MAHIQLALPALLLQIRAPSQTTFLIKPTKYSVCLSLSGGLQFPANIWDYSSKPITSSYGSQRPPLIATKPECPTVHSVPECNLHVALIGAVSSSPSCRL